MIVLKNLLKRAEGWGKSYKSNWSDMFNLPATNLPSNKFIRDGFTVPRDLPCDGFTDK